MAARNRLHPRYVRWRNAVYARDHGRCRMCGSRDRLNAHHIKRWADFPSLRFVVSNGIALCGPCHERVTGREEEFEDQFTRLVGVSSRDIRLGLIGLRYEVHGDS